MLPPTGPEPPGTTEKILLVDGVQQIHHHLLHQLILEGRNRDRPLFPILFRDIDSAEWLNLILAFFEPLMELPDVLLGVGPVLLVRDPVRGEFIKSRGNRCLVQPSTVLLPAIRGKTYRRPWSARIRQTAFYPRV